MKKPRLIPFRLLPASWGLKGSAYAEAEANYYYEGYALERKLVEIREDDETTRKVKLAQLQLKHNLIEPLDADLDIAKATGQDIREVHVKHGLMSKRDYRIELLKEKYPQFEDERHPHSSAFFDESLEVDLDEGVITKREYDLTIAEVRFGKNSPEYKIAELTADHEDGKITDRELEKSIATARSEPWVSIIDTSFDKEQGVNGLLFEFDWNDFWIAKLVENGYTGLTDDEIFEQWFSQVCYTQAMTLMNVEDIINNG